MFVGIDEYLGSERRRVFESSLGGINEMFEGEPYTSDIIAAFYGLPGVGKSLLMLQEAVWFESRGLRVLIIDTEGSMARFAREWLPVLRTRFKKKEGGGKIFLVVAKTIRSLAELFGWKADVEPKGSKMEFMVYGKSERGRLHEEMRRSRVDVVIVDSVTAPIRNEIPTAQQNLPAKSAVEAFIMGRLLDLQDRFGVAVITTHHASVNPTNPYDISAEIRGGLSIKHMAKHVVYIDRREKRGFEDIRRFWLVRAPAKVPWSEVRFAKITDAGYVDLDADPKSMLTNAELKRLRG